MDSERPSQKLSMETEDRISRLPDSVLILMLSFVPTKHAVATSILSKRWKSLWASVIVLDLDDSLLLHPQEGNTDPIGNTVSFTNFVNRVLIRRSDSFVREFKLKCRKYDSFHVNAWALAALRCGAPVLDLCVTAQQQSFNLTTDIFAFQQLVFIKLCGKFVLDVPKSVCLPNLYILHLDSIEFRDDDSIRKLCAGCPALEVLRVDDCGFKNIRVFNVSAPALKSLILCCSFNKNDDYSTEFCEYEIVVDAPALKYLRYSDFLARDYSLGSLQCLIDVYIDVNIRRGERVDVARRGIVLLNGISNSKSLTLSFFSVAIFYLLHGRWSNLPMFHNLTRLTLEVNKYCGLLLPMLLENSPNLEILVLDVVHPWRIEEFKWNPPPHVPECLLLHLKEVEIKGFILQEDLLKLIKYLSENARVLNKVSGLPES